MFSRQITSDLEIKLSLPDFAQDIFAITESNREFLSEWLPWLNSIKNADDTKTFINEQLIRFAKGEAVHVTIFSKGEVAGVAGFNTIDQVNGIGYIGYWLSEEYNGRGIMTNVVSDLIKIAREDLKLQKVDIRCASGNHKSRAIPERLGFSHEGTLSRAEKVYEKWLDHEVYGLLL